VSALTTAAFASLFPRFFAVLRMIFEMSMPTTSLTFSSTLGNSRPVPQPASSMKFSSLRMSPSKAAFIFASCSS